MNILVVFPSELEARGFSATSVHTVETLVSGIGGFATMYNLTKYCVKNRPDFIIHAGICGSFDETLNLGDVVCVMIDQFADFGVIENGQWKTGFEMKLISSHKKPFTQGELVAPNNDIVPYPKVIAVTSQTITSTTKQQEELERKFHPAIETMEGAYVHYVCIQEDIPFVHIRAVSNTVGERDKTKWDIKTAIANLHEAINNVIANL